MVRILARACSELFDLKCSNARLIYYQQTRVLQLIPFWVFLKLSPTVASDFKGIQIQLSSQARPVLSA